MKNLKLDTLQIRLSEKMKKELRELAKEWNMTPSEYVREKITEGYTELLSMRYEAEADSKLSPIELIKKLIEE